MNPDWFLTDTPSVEVIDRAAQAARRARSRSADWHDVVRAVITALREERRPGGSE
jgi:hypothetical protein